MLKYDDDRRIIENFIINNSLDVLPATDDSLKTNKNSFDMAAEHKQSMLEHSGKYTDILDIFITNSRETSEQKLRFKKHFFYFSIFSLGFVTLLFIVLSIFIFATGTNETNVGALSTLGTTFVSLLSMYIIIPKIIAKYLFNRKEDKNMITIIKSIQNYDERVDLHNFDDSKSARNKKKEKRKKYKNIQNNSAV